MNFWRIFRNFCEFSEFPENFRNFRRIFGGKRQNKGISRYSILEVRYDILFDMLKVSIYQHSIISRYDTPTLGCGNLPCIIGQEEECAHFWEVDQVTAFWFKCTSVLSVKARVKDICRGFSKSLALVWPESKLDVLVRAQNSIYWGRGSYAQIALFYKYLYCLWEVQKGQQLLYMKNMGRVYGGLGCNTIKLQFAINRN